MAGKQTIRLTIRDVPERLIDSGKLDGATIRTVRRKRNPSGKAKGRRATLIVDVVLTTSPPARILLDDQTAK